MKKINLITSLIWIGLGVIQSLESIKLKLGDLHNPGPGLMPFFLGVCLVLLGSILFLTFFSQHFKKREELQELQDQKVWRRDILKPVLLPLGALFGYVLLFERLGFIMTSFLFLFFLLKLKDSKRLMIPLLFSTIAVAVSYLIFSVWLRNPLPAGIMDFKSIWKVF